MVAVYAQTLSYTDGALGARATRTLSSPISPSHLPSGIADDLPAILAVIEKENLRRASAARRGGYLTPNP